MHIRGHQRTSKIKTLKINRNETELMNVGESYELIVFNDKIITSTE